MAAIRGRIAQRFVAAAEDERGGLLAALVLGSAQVSVLDALRESARVALVYPMPWRRPIFIFRCC